MDRMCDPSSQANYGDYRLFHSSLQCEVDFENRRLKTSAELHFRAIDPSVKHLILDTSNVEVFDVKIKDPNKTLLQAVFELLPARSYLGSALKVDVSSVTLDENELVLIITCQTTDKCEAIQWMAKEQTAGKRQPYLFSQCQSILCRNIFPCQDTPGVKFTYDAEVSVPKGIAVVMSALFLGISDEGKTTTVHKFSQKEAIPAYLFAIAAGDIIRGDLSERCAVWTEPELMDACRYEFAEVESILQIAENICGPYMWTRYDFLVLPPSFPFGGMENPNMTFLSPTLLAGDRSLVNVLAHEITHSWTGNLVTTVSWEHFWLNEGWTRFIEDKIKAIMGGDENIRKFEASMELKNLADDINTFREQKKYELTALVPDLTSSDPEDAFSLVPYEKGQNLLCYIEEKVGGPDAFAPYIKDYLKTFKDTPVNTKMWLEHLLSYFSDKKELLESMPWTEIFLTPGPMAFERDLTNPLTTKCKEISNKWLSAPDNANFQELIAELGDCSTLSTDAKTEVLRSICETKPKWSKEKFWAFSNHLDASRLKNCEIRTPWLRIGLSCELEEIIDPTVELVKEVGRLKFCRPLYRAMNAWEVSRATALETFQIMKECMNPITIRGVAIDLGLEDA